MEPPIAMHHEDREGLRGWIALRYSTELQEIPERISAPVARWLTG